MDDFFLDATKAVVTLPDFNSTQDIGVFVGNLYTFSLQVLGIVIFVRFIWAGWLYISAAGNAANVSKAKSVMTNAIAGALLLLASYLILYVINPDLVCNTFSFDILNPNSQAGTQCPR